MTRRRRLLVILALIAGMLNGCHARDASRQQSGASLPPVQDACALALAPHQGTEAIDLAIARLQEAARRTPNPVPVFHELGQRFIAKARTAHDPSHYQRAEACAQCADTLDPGNAQSLLLRGHVLHQMHRFQEAERLARELVARRGLFLDYGLLGDSLMEQGHVDEAGQAYQRMIDLKPFYQSYTRAAHLRWLRGDLASATTLIRMAIRAASPRDPESAAWAYTRLAWYELQAGRFRAAREASEAALTYQSSYPAALLVRGRTLLASKTLDEAIISLRSAAAADPSPEYQWALAEALGAAGRTDEARTVEASIERTGPAADPRTFALYLASRRERVDDALALARRERQARGDPFTLDALAWSLAASGRAREADEVMQQALRLGTADARLFYHAGVIAAAVEDRARARHWLQKALALRQMLLPSEASRAASTLVTRRPT
jgi:tetratricopeptide (TPR) repeat protein